MQRFFAGSGDKNGGLEKRKNKSKDKIQGKESEKDSGKGCDGGTSGAQRKRKEAFESSSGEESNINSKDSSRKTTSSKKSFFSPLLQVTVAILNHLYVVDIVLKVVNQTKYMLYMLSNRCDVSFIHIKKLMQNIILRNR